MFGEDEDDTPEVIPAIDAGLAPGGSEWWNGGGSGGGEWNGDVSDPESILD